jgi:glycosyltransferase involved in cell wall biosynthesis
MREDVARMGIARDKMIPIPMGIDPERFDRPVAVPANEPRLVGKRVIAYLGTCDRLRRIDFLFEVLAVVLARFPDALLLIVGDAPEDEDKRWLRQRAVEIGVSESVIITGWVSPDEGQGWMATAEVAVSIFAPDPLLDSCSPTKLVEYLALGKAVVANDQPDQSVVVNESQAGFCVPFEVDAFAAAVMQLLDHPGEAARMAARGPDYVQRKRSYPILAERVAEVYRRWIKLDGRSD